mmetsp:Transcript_15785/g.43138  ORF Transcript_15785/g.43138 Transcript_15785/m.43138 type:complete len:369 (+) Transcript_15785:278-1384(+)
MPRKAHGSRIHAPPTRTASLAGCRRPARERRCVFEGGFPPVFFAGGAARGAGAKPRPRSPGTWRRPQTACAIPGSDAWGPRARLRASAGGPRGPIQPLHACMCRPTNSARRDLRAPREGFSRSARDRSGTPNAMALSQNGRASPAPPCYATRRAPPALSRRRNCNAMRSDPWRRPRQGNRQPPRKAEGRTSFRPMRPGKDSWCDEGLSKQKRRATRCASSCPPRLPRQASIPRAQAQALWASPIAKCATWHGGRRDAHHATSGWSNHTTSRHLWSRATKAVPRLSGPTARSWRQSPAKLCHRRRMCKAGPFWSPGKARGCKVLGCRRMAGATSGRPSRATTRTTQESRPRGRSLLSPHTTFALGSGRS